MGSEPIWQCSFVKDQPRKHLIYIYIYIYMYIILLYTVSVNFEKSAKNNL